LFENFKYFELLAHFVEHFNLLKTIISVIKRQFYFGMGYQF